MPKIAEDPGRFPPPYGSGDASTEPKATPNNVINIMDALRKSVEAQNRPGKR
ncbi:hypothetical protein AB4Z43_29550 [Mesorhizobium sp. 2RAF45]|uniref:hypothetical protein n=1 Tax=Mesorhizobium sp. 2RAF45 TaxID=3233001 RepID=UPI003F9511F7